MMQIRGEFLRYGITMALGLVVDLGVARTTLAIGLPITLAAALGLACGAAFNYTLLGFWAFQGRKTGSAAARPWRYLGALSLTMAVRSGTVWALQIILPASTRPLAILGLAVLSSFLANFLLSKYWVFPKAQPS